MLDATKTLDELLSELGSPLSLSRAIDKLTLEGFAITFQAARKGGAVSTQALFGTVAKSDRGKLLCFDFAISLRRAKLDVLGLDYVIARELVTRALGIEKVIKERSNAVNPDKG